LEAQNAHILFYLIFIYHCCLYFLLPAINIVPNKLPLSLCTEEESKKENQKKKTSLVHVFETFVGSERARSLTAL
jgi:hypothetical protein